MFIVAVTIWIFQFHYGTIKSAVVPTMQTGAPNFNSTMVRLKVRNNAKISKITAFQFHYGTIKRSEYARRMNL